MKEKNNTDTPGPFANLFEQAAQISKAHAYDILADQVKELKEENERLKRNMDINMRLALEFGYLQCEKGENIQAAFQNYNALNNSK